MKHFMLFAPLLLLSFGAKSQTIKANPNWHISIPANTITEAGNNYKKTINCDIGQTWINFKIGNKLLMNDFTIKVHKIDTDWHQKLEVWVQRIGHGTSSNAGSSFTGGLAYLQIADSPQTFFSGTTTGANNAHIQYEIRGVSVLIPAKTYSTTLVFTISD